MKQAIYKFYYFEIIYQIVICINIYKMNFKTCKYILIYGQLKIANNNCAIICIKFIFNTCFDKNFM